MRHEPGRKEDAKNLSIIAGSASLAVLVTVALLAAEPEQVPRRNVVTHIEAEAADEVQTYTDFDRLYGTVRTTAGAELTGFIRWDRNEGSRSDLLDAYKPRERGGSSVSGIRFGHVDRIEVLSRDAARFTLKSGEIVELDGRATDLGSGLRALQVDVGGGEVAELEWRDLEQIDFLDSAPREPTEGRLFGTLTTRSGLEFTGHVTWDVDEIYTTDVLDGDDPAGDRRRIPFGEIESIQRRASWAAEVVLRDGTALTLEGTNDVDDSNGGISVSDPGLGQISVDWRGFERVRFHEPDEETASVRFDGGVPIRGTVVTVSGDELSGAIVWDDDEAFTWEMLNGELEDVEFNVEFGQITEIVKAGEGVRVTLRDGRTFRLTGSNDVDEGNRGILIEAGGRTVEVEWDDFVEARLTHE